MEITKTDIDTPDRLNGQFHQVTELLQELYTFGSAGISSVDGFVRTLESVTIELRNAKSTQLTDALNKIASKIEFITTTRYGERRELLDEIAEVIRLYSKADIVTLYEISADGRPKYWPGIAGKFYKPDTMATEMRLSDIVFRVLELRRPEYVSDAQGNSILTSKRIVTGDEDNLQRTRFVFRESIRSTAIIPLSYSDQLEGLLFLNYRESQKFLYPHQQEIERLASDVSSTLHSIRLYRLSLEYNEQLETLLQIIQNVLQNAPNRSNMLDIIIQGAVEVIGISRGAIVLWNEHQSYGEVVSEYCVMDGLHKFKGQHFNKDTPLQQRILAGETIVARDTSSPEQFSEIERERFQQAEIKSTLIVPVFDEGRVIASIGVDETRYNRNFSDRDIRLCNTLASQATIVLKLADTMYDLHDLTKTMELQQEVIDASIAHIDPDVALSKILRDGLALLPNANTGQLLLLDESEKQLVTMASTIPDEIGLSYSIDNSVTGQAVKDRKVKRLEDVSKESELYQPGYEPIRMVSELAVPLINGDKVIGVLNAESVQEGAFSIRDAKVWENLARGVVKIVNLAQILGEQKAFSILNNTLHLAIQAEGQNLSVLLRTILDNGREFADATIGQILLLNNDDLEIIESTEQDIGRHLSLDNSVTGLAVRKQASINVKNLEKDEDPTIGPYRDFYKWPAGDEKRMLSELAVPLKFGSEIIGVINFESPKPHAFTELHERLIESLATMAAAIIELSQKYILQRRNQELEISNAQSRDISDILHRINNPLGLVQQFARFALNRISELNLQDATLTNDIRRVDEKAQEIAELVRKLRSDLRDVDAYPIDVNKALQQALNFFQDNFKASGVIFDQRFEMDLPKIRCGNKIDRIFYDLIKNAFESLKEGKGTITLIGRGYGTGVEVQIQDTGIGIPPEEIEYIFEDWFYNTNKNTASNVGRGLGLYWAKRFLDAYQAEIFPTSTPGTGTTMTIRFKPWDI